jgi:hypothetical protein
LLGRAERQVHAGAYVRGLLLDGERKFIRPLVDPLSGGGECAFRHRDDQSPADVALVSAAGVDRRSGAPRAGQGARGGDLRDQERLGARGAGYRARAGRRPPGGARRCGRRDEPRLSRGLGRPWPALLRANGAQREGLGHGRDRNFNRGGSAIRRVYDAITARARTDRRAAACPPPRARASRAVGTAGTVGGMPAGTNLPRRWGRPPTPKVPAGGGASGLGSGDRRGVGGRAWGA